jgi:hypothetical protein
MKEFGIRLNGVEMIYSPDHKFLLLKNRKVGGSSLEISLSKVLPDNAIVSPLNGSKNIWDPIPPDHFSRNYKTFIFEGVQRALFYNHISYLEVQEKLDLSDVKSYVFVRNPYNSVLSDFFHKMFFFKKELVWSELSKEEKNNLINQYFNDEFGKWDRGDIGIYLDKNYNILVDKILYYENGIENEINPILKKHNIPEIKINVFDKAHKPKNLTYQDVFLKKHLDLIRKERWWEFKNLNYQL